MSRFVVVTTINEPTKGLKKLVRTPGWGTIVVGDKKTPGRWALDGARFLAYADQHKLGFAYAKSCPPNSYARKNVGYLAAMATGCEAIAETDDDNIPGPRFLCDVRKVVKGKRLRERGWINMYRLYTKQFVWPRGFPLALVQQSCHRRPRVGPEVSRSCAIQQYLADNDPDVDALYRLLYGAPVKFASGSYLLTKGQYCPFNSQNTLWFPEAFVLMYLPAFVSFRMTDIWRSFVAQACLHAAGRAMAFHGPTVVQQRNAHDLLRDFESEVPGYLENRRMVEVLQSLRLKKGADHVARNLLACYRALVETGVVPSDELKLLEYWVADLRALRVVT